MTPGSPGSLGERGERHQSDPDEEQRDGQAVRAATPSGSAPNGRGTARDHPDPRGGRRSPGDDGRPCEGTPACERATSSPTARSEVDPSRRLFVAPPSRNAGNRHTGTTTMEREAESPPPFPGRSRRSDAIRRNADDRAAKAATSTASSPRTAPRTPTQIVHTTMGMSEDLAAKPGADPSQRSEDVLVSPLHSTPAPRSRRVARRSATMTSNAESTRGTSHTTTDPANGRTFSIQPRVDAAEPSHVRGPSATTRSRTATPRPRAGEEQRVAGPGRARGHAPTAPNTIPAPKTPAESSADLRPRVPGPRALPTRRRRRARTRSPAPRARRRWRLQADPARDDELPAPRSSCPASGGSKPTAPTRRPGSRSALPSRQRGELVERIDPSRETVERLERAIPPGARRPAVGPPRWGRPPVLPLTTPSPRPLRRRGSTRPRNDGSVADRDAAAGARRRRSQSPSPSP